MEVHHGRSTQGSTSLTTHQLDKAVGALVPEAGIGIGPVIDGVLPVGTGGKTFADYPQI